MNNDGFSQRHGSLPPNRNAEQGVATNRLPVASRKRHDYSTIKIEIGVRSQAACGSTLTLL